MPTITPTVTAAKTYVRLDADFTDTDAAYALVQRVDSSTGAATTVRSHGVSTSVGGVAYSNMYAGYRATLYDTEVPLDTPVYYTATAPATTLNINTQFSGGVQEPWVPTLGTGTTTAMLYTTFYPTLAPASYVMTMHGDGATANPQIHAEYVPATPGATLTFSAMLNWAVAGTQAVTVGIAWYNSSQTLISSAGTVQTLTGGVLTTVTYSLAAPANTAYAVPFVQINGTPAAGNLLWVGVNALTSAAATATSSPVLVSSNGACWLKDPLRPANNVRVDLWIVPDPTCTPSEGVFFVSLDPEQMPANAAMFNVANSPYPVVVSRVRSSDTSKLTLASRTFADRDRLRALLSPGSPLLWQVPGEYGSPDRYLGVGTVDITRVHPDHRFPIRIFGLPFGTVLAPVGPAQGVAGARWQDACDVYASWSAVNSAGVTWTQVLDGAIG